jgi:hypothetical protein
MPVDLTADVNTRLDVLVERLAEEFGSRVPRREVAASVRRVRREFGEPPITQFLPILIERQVRATLNR